MTVGYLLQETSKYLVIASTYYHKEGETYTADITWLPKGMIKTVEKLYLSKRT